MKDTSKWTITREPAVYEGIEYSKIVYRDENGNIVQEIDDPPCMIGNDISELLFLFSGLKAVTSLPKLLKNIKPKITITGIDKVRRLGFNPTT